MSRRPRVSICGYHHVYNRGVDKNNIFLEDLDKEKFLELLCEISKEYKFNIHSFCLMSNHYHLLLENKKENLSDGMRQLNSKYAKYFNQKYKRIGHFWQDRFKSFYVGNEKYLFTLFKYIETNPVKAGTEKKVGQYKYSATYCIIKDAIPRFLKNSFVLRNYNTKELFEALNIPLNEKEIENVKKFKKAKFTVEGKNISCQRVALYKYFLHLEDKKDRNRAILEAYKNDYTKSEIARELSLSVAGVSKIIKNSKY